MGWWERVHTYLYDKLVKSELFNRVVWGLSASNYRQFVQKALDAPAGSAIMDAACGPLTFTADLYGKDTSHRLVLIDLSREALAVACKRLDKHGGACDRIELVRASVFNIPYKDNEFDRIINMGFLHLFSEEQDIRRILKEFYRVARPGARLYFMMLTSDRQAGRPFLYLLWFLRQIGKPHTSAFFGQLIEKAGFTVVSARLKGSMFFVEAVKPS